MLRTIALFLAVFAISPAAAQQMHTDIPTLQLTISVLEQQRNNIANQATLAEVRAATLQAELEKARARIKELELKAAEAKPAEPKKE